MAIYVFTLTQNKLNQDGILALYFYSLRQQLSLRLNVCQLLCVLCIFIFIRVMLIPNIVHMNWVECLLCVSHEEYRLYNATSCCLSRVFNIAHLTSISIRILPEEETVRSSPSVSEHWTCYRKQRLGPMKGIFQNSQNFPEFNSVK